MLKLKTKDMETTFDLSESLDLKESKVETRKLKK